MRLHVVVLSLSLLAACGGGGSAPDDQSSPAEVDRYGAPHGVLVLHEQAGQYQLDAWFTRVPEPVSTGQILWEDGKQQCRRTAEIDLSTMAKPTTNAPPRAGSLWQQTLSAGLALEIRARGGVVARLQSQQLGKAVLYATDEHSLDEPLPEDAYLHIPGTADFPGFESVSLTPLTPLLVTAPQTGLLTDYDEAIEWQRSTSAGDVIELTLSLVDETGTVSSNFVCVLNDSGRFMLPGTLQEFLPDNAQEVQTAMLRRRSSVHEAGGASLRIMQLSRP